jgi:hypothetical protein
MCWSLLLWVSFVVLGISHTAGGGGGEKGRQSEVRSVSNVSFSALNPYSPSVKRISCEWSSQRNAAKKRPVWPSVCPHPKIWNYWTELSANLVLESFAEIWRRFYISVEERVIAPGPLAHLQTGCEQWKCRFQKDVSVLRGYGTKTVITVTLLLALSRWSFI